MLPREDLLREIAPSMMLFKPKPFMPLRKSGNMSPPLPIN
ncbi:hypothetical protein Z947_587 [Sulfitobacter geojensis]|nr:hypothetical protein Z947_587 [Sulfitobacter geojensis]